MTQNRGLLMKKHLAITRKVALLILVSALLIATGGVGYVQAEAHPPVSNPGGPYLVHIGEDLSLDGSQSRDSDFPDDAIVQYLWDLDNDAVYDEIVTSNPVVLLHWADLVSFLGFTPHVGMAYHISLKVVDSTDRTSEAAETLIIIAEPFVVPEYLLGGLSALGACFVALVAFKRQSLRKK